MNIFLKPKKPMINISLKTLLLISGLFMFISGIFTPIYALFVKEIGG